MTSGSALPQVRFIYSRPRGFWNTSLCLLASDALTLLLSVAAGLIFKWAIHGISDWEPYLRLWPFLFVFLAVYALMGLYSGLALSPPAELQRITLSTALVFFALAAATVSIRGGRSYFTWTTLIAALVSVILLPLNRAIVRRRFATEPWWGAPAVVIGAGPAGNRAVRAMLAEPGLGLKPIAVLDEEFEGRAIHGVPVMSYQELARMIPDTYQISYAVVAMPDVPSAGFLSMLESYGLRFTRILMIPDLSNFCALWVNAKVVGGMLGLEVCQQAFVPGLQWPKRVLDLVLTLIGGVLILPLLGLIALAILIDSRGRVFYSQARIGRDGEIFSAWKFRSMVRNADAVLDDYLARYPHLREEWERDHKLRNDPRITRVGRILRRTSLDELPQLWNVLKGEMSLVGPRPIVSAEIVKYGNKFDLYTRVKSGITGLWQVSGRNDTSYEERVNFDVFYVRNWSVWLDFYILCRTIETVLFRKGAY
jgi:Undecaprenyl-phosphate galactose phosphotransferase WbaP